MKIILLVLSLSTAAYASQIGSVKPLPINQGGTGTSTAGVVGGVPYYVSATAMGVLAAGTSGQVLTSAGAGAPTWGAGGGGSAPTSRILLDTYSGFGSTNTQALIFTNITSNNGGSDLTYTTDATNGDKIVVNTAGMYSVTLSCDGAVTASLQDTILKNATAGELQTLGMDASVGHRLCFAYLPAAAAGEQVATCSATTYFAATDVITFTQWSAGSHTPNSAGRCMAGVARLN